MQNYKTVSKIGGAMAALSILFLPVVGCGNESLTGIQIVQSSNVGLNIKAFLLIAVLCGFALCLSSKQSLR